MLCNDVKRVVYFFLDGALADPKQKDFTAHLTLCPDCETRTAFHRRLRTFLQKRLERIHATAPDRLRMRLTRSIRAFRAEWSR